MALRFVLGLRVRLMLLVLAAVVPALLLIVYSAFEQRQEAAEHAKQETLKMARTIAEGHRPLILSAHQILTSLATLAEIPDAESAGPCNKLMANTLRFNPDYANLGVALMDGTLVCGALPFNRNHSIADRTYFQRALASRAFSVGDYQLGRIVKKPGISFSMPLFNVDQQMWGVVFVFVDLSRLNQRLAAMPYLEKSDVAFTLDSLGNFLERHPDPEKYVGKSIANLPLFLQIQRSPGEGTHESVDIDGIKRVYAYTPLFPEPKCCNYAVAGIPAERVYYDANHGLVRNLALASGIAILVLALAWVGSDLLVLRRIRALVEAAKRMGRHDLAARSSLPHEDDEIGQLARTFDEMAGNLENWAQQVLQSGCALEEIGVLNQMILDSAGEGICGVDAQGRIVFINPAAATMLGYRVEELIGLPLHDTVHYQKADGSPFPSAECPIQLAISDGKAHGSNDEMLWRKDGSGFYADYVVAPVAKNGEVSGAVLTFRDISERKHYEEQLAHQTTHDTLTGLANRTLLADRLGLLIERASRDKKVIAVFFLDLDRFNEINDSLGHSAGDELLCAVAQRLSALVRGSDTVARPGGDEFVILVEIEDVEGALPMVQKILAAMTQPFDVAQQEVFASASIGISLYPKDGRNGEYLLKNADAAMYRAKKHGRNTFQFYAESMNASSAARLNLETNLRRAVDNGELLLHYQPQVNLHSGEIIGAEALIRWNHPELGLIPPADFIPLAEETGLIFPIGEWVLQTACTQMKAWHVAGLAAPTVAVNLSAHQFRDQNLIKLTTGVLLDAGLDGRYLELEMTESAVMEDLARVVKLLNELREAGIEVSIDDFGTGYSSLSYLKKLPIDRLKIDQAFVNDLTRDPNDAAITLAIITMGHSLGLNVIAEGVETSGQLEFLRSHGCDEMQGFYFSHPVPASDFEQLLREGRKLQFPLSTRRSERTLLLVDDEANITAALKRLFHRQGYNVLVAQSAGEGFELLAMHQVGVIICDQGMPEMTGIEFLSRVKRLYPDAIRIVLSGYSDYKLVADTFNRGAIYKFITKPWEDGEMLGVVKEAFQKYETESQRPGTNG